MGKIKIGDGEYVPPFTCDADYDNPSDWMRDSNENPVDYEDAASALNELAALRADVQKFKDLHDFDSSSITELESLLNGDDKALRAERDALVKERDESREGGIEQGFQIVILERERDALKREIQEARSLIVSNGVHLSPVEHDQAVAWLQRNKPTKGGE